MSQRLLFYIIFVLHMSWRGSLQAQPLEDWNGVFNGGRIDRAVTFALDAATNVYVTGFSSDTESDIITLKYSNDGNQLWSRRAGQTGVSEFPVTITANAAGDLWVAGHTQGPENASSWVIFHYTSAGDLLWERHLESPPAEPNSAPVGLVIDQFDNAYVSGAGQGGVFLILKFSPDGEALWVKSASQPAEGTPVAMGMDSSGNILVVGNRIGAEDQSDVMLVKFDPEGETVWTAVYDGDGLIEDQYAVTMTTDAASNIYVTGGRTSNLGGGRLMTLMFSSDGVLQWQASYSGPANENVEGTAIQLDSDANVYVAARASYARAGTFVNDFMVAKYDANGAHLWTSRYPAPDSFAEANQLTTFRYNTNGNLIWIVSKPSTQGKVLLADVANTEAAFFRVGLTRMTEVPPPADESDMLVIKYTEGPPPNQPSVSILPGSIESVAGSNVVLIAAATGPGPLRYQWRYNGRPLSNATNSDLRIDNAPASSAGDYSVIVSNAASYTISAEARVVLHVPATITSAAQTNTVSLGDSVLWTVSAIGEAPLFYQWLSNSVPIANAIGDTLRLENLQQSSAGSYSVIVSNAYGVAMSQPFRLTVVPKTLQLTLQGSWPGYPRAPMRDVAVVGNRAFVAMAQRGIAAFDITDAARPIRLGAHGTAGPAGKITVAGGYAYVSEGGRWTGSNYVSVIEIFDISDPLTPKLAASLETPGGDQLNNNLVVSGHFAFLAAGSSGVQAIDISDPNRPAIVGSFDTSGYAMRIFVMEARAFIADSYGGLKIIDITDPSKMRQLGAFTTCAGRIQDVVVRGDYAYAADSDEGLIIVNVTDPENPKRSGGNGRPQSPIQLQIIENHLYALGAFWSGVNWVSQIYVYDLSEPADPIRLARTDINAMGEPYGMEVLGPRAFVAAGDAGLQVYDFTDLARPQLVSGGELSGFARAVSLSGNHAYVADSIGGAQILDVSEPSAIRRVARIPASGMALDIALSEDRAIVADGNFGLELFDITSPTMPTALPRLAAGQPPMDEMAVQTVGDVTYLLAGGSLEIIDTSRSSAPQRIGTYQITDRRALGFQVVGGRAYFVGQRSIDEDHDIGFIEIVDISNPSSPVSLARADTATRGHAVAIKGDFAFIAGEQLALTVMEIKDPNALKAVGQFDASGAAESIELFGDYAILASQSIGVLLLDVTEPRNVFRLDQYRFDNVRDEDFGCDVWVGGSRAYVTRGSDGLLVFEITGLPVLSAALNGREVVISWGAPAGYKLQQSTSLQNPGWTDASAEQALSPARFPVSGGAQYFRLIKP